MPRPPEAAARPDPDPNSATATATATDTDTDTDTASLSALAPLRHPVFRMLWTTWLVANVGMWISDVAAAWMMTSLTTAPIWVALVQTASTLPVFLLGLPSGALADILDRRRYFIFTQVWVAGVATLMCVVLLSGRMTPALLLALTFANGIGLALRWPVFSAIVPELVPRAQLPAALALNGVATNASRIAGPIIAGAVIASAGSVWVFVLNAVLSLICGCVIMRWQRAHVPHPLGRESLVGAMRVGLQFVRQSRPVKASLLRTAVFFFHSTALLALLPLIARDLGGSAATFTLLLAAMGAGAIAAALLLPRLRRAISMDGLVLYAALLHSVTMIAVALSHHVWLSAVAMCLSGMAWIAAANPLSVSVQLALPDWVRARGMSMFQMAIMGAGALGAALWGQVATVSSIQASLTIAALSGALAMRLAHRMVAGHSGEEDLTPSHELAVPVVASPPAGGQVQLTIEYRIAPERAGDFLPLMQESRRRRLGQGALRWSLLRDIADPACYVEQIVDASWTEHLRRFERVTAADIALRERKLAFHVGVAAPLVTRRVVEILDSVAALPRTV